MKPKKWNTQRLAVYGAFAGAAYSVVKLLSETSDPYAAYYLSYVFGGAVGGAILIALISGVRNMFVRP